MFFLIFLFNYIQNISSHDKSKISLDYTFTDKDFENFVEINFCSWRILKNWAELTFAENKQKPRWFLAAKVYDHKVKKELPTYRPFCMAHCYPNTFFWPNKTGNVSRIFYRHKCCLGSVMACNILRHISNKNLHNIPCQLEQQMLEEVLKEQFQHI